MARALLREDRRRSGNNIILEEDESLSLIDQVTERVHALVEACNQQQSNIQLIVFQVVSSIRSVLTEANIVNKESQILRNYPDLAKQRKLVLSALSRLVLKGKELQQQQEIQTQEIDLLSDFANQLLHEMESFERLLVSIPRHSFYSSTDSDYTTRPSSMFHDTPRSSISSLGHSSVISTNSTSLRQIISEARHNSNSNTNSLIKPVPTDTEHILQSISDHQVSIDDLMKTLIITLEKYLINRIRATDMLEITRKAVESVRTFLAIVEHVCSNLGDLDYNRRLSMIPEDPRLVSLVLTKESVYSAITNLVTAVRALTGPQLEDDEEEHHYHLPVCCQIVVETTNECADCVRACLEEEEEKEEEDKNMRHPLHQQLEQQQHENSRSQHTLSILGRKVTSLQALQQYELDQVTETEKEIESLAIEPSSVTSTENTLPLPSPTIEKYENKKARASLQINTTIDALPQRTKLRARAASVNNIQKLMSSNLPLPPLPLMRPSVSAAPIGSEAVATTDVPLKLRRSRGRSVSSLRTSINKSKSERMLTSTSTDSLPEPLQPKKLSSWRSAHSSHEQLKSEPIINSVLKVNIEM